MIGGGLRCILNRFLQQLRPVQSWETGFFSAADCPIDHEVKMIGGYSGFVNVLYEGNGTSRAVVRQ
jgi:hypothetical protein